MTRVLAIDVATATVVSSVTTDPTPDTVSTPSLAVAADGTIYQTDSTDNALRILYVGVSRTISRRWSVRRSWVRPTTRPGW